MKEIKGEKMRAEKEVFAAALKQQYVEVVAVLPFDMCSVATFFLNVNVAFLPLYYPYSTLSSSFLQSM